MNPDYIINSLNENTLNKFSYRPFAKIPNHIFILKQQIMPKNGIKLLNHII
jgi:hypothetical protein